MSGADTLALLGGQPVRGPEKQWPGWPLFDDAERRALNEVLESGKWWYGERVGRFEREFAAFQGAGHCVTCTSGTTALEVAIQALGIGPGDEVIVPPYTFIATATAVLRMGAHAVFADVDDTWCIDPDAVETAVTPRTKAVVPVHFGGRVCDMDRLTAVAERHGLVILEDACHSWGARWKGRGTGVLGRCGVFSFQETKNITSAEGGAIVTDDEDLADMCRSITNCGRARGSAWYSHENLGTNARITEFQAAILSAQLARLDEQTERRARNAAIIDKGLAGIDGVAVQPGDDRITRRAYHLYCARIDPDRFGCDRDRFVEAADAEGLPIGGGYGRPINAQPVLARWDGGRAYGDVRCPVAEDLCYRTGTWFDHEVLLGTEEDMADIVRIFEKVKANAPALATPADA